MKGRLGAQGGQKEVSPASLRDKMTQNTLYPIFKSCPYSIGGYLLFDI